MLAGMEDEEVIVVEGTADRTSSPNATSVVADQSHEAVPQRNVFQLMRAAASSKKRKKTIKKPSKSSGQWLQCFLCGSTVLQSELNLHLDKSCPNFFGGERSASSLASQEAARTPSRPGPVQAEASEGSMDCSAAPSLQQPAAVAQGLSDTSQFDKQGTCTTETGSNAAATTETASATTQTSVATEAAQSRKRRRVGASDNLHTYFGGCDPTVPSYFVLQWPKRAFFARSLPAGIKSLHLSFK